ncbi:efflux transporter outer membrane subunit [Pseudomonas sp.]|uniref:efflux transporter outer membrane subunit n=1 Tax=Pseudomonas sp. TaxID=306 RepID=UPI000FB9325D
MTWHIRCAGIVTLILTGCAVGPHYDQPLLPLGSVMVSEQEAGYELGRFEVLWWKQFEDPVLDRLVAQSLERNRDIRAAFARWRMARALRDDVANDRFPIITSRTSADIGKGQLPGLTEALVNQERYDLGLDTAWELDLFGRIRHQLESSDARSEAAKADLQQLQVSLIAELVDAYGTLRGAQLRERIAQSNLGNQRNSLNLTKQRREVGMGAELDVLRAQARLEATKAQIPGLQAEAARARHRIASLLGMRPDQVIEDLSPQALPAISTGLPVGEPTDLLRRRPDIRAAERRLAASTAEVGVATADLFPRVSLSGFLGFTAGRGSQLGSSAAKAWSVAPALTWSAFDLGSLRARLRAAEASSDVALAQYEQQVLLALEEAANAFGDYGKRQERLEALMLRSNASRGAAQQATTQYQEGIVDFLVLLDAEREQLSAEDAQAEAEVDLYRGIVAIYRALGGGWQPTEPHFN